MTQFLGVARSDFSTNAMNRARSHDTTLEKNGTQVGPVSVTLHCIGVVIIQGSYASSLLNNYSYSDDQLLPQSLYSKISGTILALLEIFPFIGCCSWFDTRLISINKRGTHYSARLKYPQVIH